MQNRGGTLVGATLTPGGTGGTVAASNTYMFLQAVGPNRMPREFGQNLKNMRRDLLAEDFKYASMYN